MKTRTFILAMIGALTLFAGCKDPCKNVACLNGGSCDAETGQCVCPDGFSGIDCSVEDPNRKVSGSYTVQETCGGNTTTRIVTITPVAGTTNEVDVEGLYGQGEIQAMVSSDGLSLTVALQTFGGSALYQLESNSFTLSADLNTLTYSIDIYLAGSFQQTCTGAGTRN